MWVEYGSGYGRGEGEGKEKWTYKGDGLDEITCDFTDDFKVIILVEHSSLAPGCAHPCSSVSTLSSGPERAERAERADGQPKAHIFIAFRVPTVRFKRRDLAV